MKSSGVSWCRGKGRQECRQLCARTKGKSQPRTRRFSYHCISWCAVKNKIHLAIEFSLPKKLINLITFLWAKDESWLSRFQSSTKIQICKFIIQKNPNQNPKTQTKIDSAWSFKSYFASHARLSISFHSPRKWSGLQVLQCFLLLRFTGLALRGFSYVSRGGKTSCTLKEYSQGA